MARTKHAKYTGAIASARVELEKRPKRAMKNKGLHQYRFKDNPLEEVFAKAWENENTAKGGAIEGHGYLDYLLAEDCNRPAGEVTDRDRVVAATVIQWLGSPIGQCFIKDCLSASQKFKKDQKCRR